jgi:hypothetical protein
MTRNQLPKTVTASTMPRHQERVTIRYEGTCEIYVPASDGRPGAVTQKVSCGHQHAGWDAAEKCAQSAARRKAAELDAQWAAKIKDLPCDYRAYGDGWTSFDGGEPLWQKFCAAHHTAAYSPWKLCATEAEALAQDWACPWEKVAR